MIVSAMLRSIPSMGHVLMLLALLLYVYGILGYSLFHEHDPKHWGRLGASIGTLFQILTLEGWVEVQAASAAATPWAWLFYSSFIVIAVFVLINLFIAVVINNLEAAKREQQSEADAKNPQGQILTQIDALRRDLAELERQLRSTARAAGA